VGASEIFRNDSRAGRLLHVLVSSHVSSLLVSRYVRSLEILSLQING
jgi:hypothetical protein